ncbi:Cytohesin-1 [Haplosporangium bisporale]|nr:Cytohesin-1 [Haplosporangium bisporale]
MSSLSSKEREGIDSSLCLQRIHNLAPRHHLTPPPPPPSRSKQWDPVEGETLSLKQNLDKTLSKPKKKLPLLDKPAHLPIHVVSSSSSSSSSSSVPLHTSNTLSGSDLVPNHLYMASPSPHACHGLSSFDGQQYYLQPMPKPNERSKFSKKKSRSKSENHGDAKDNDHTDKKDKKNKTPYHSSSSQVPSTIESLFLQERQLRGIVDQRMMLEEWLFKRSSSLQLVWKKRWCVLRDNCLYYYSSNTDTKPLGVLHLADFSILTTGADLSRKSKHAFRLSAAESIPHESRHHLFHTETVSSLDVWVEAIQTHIDHAQSTLTMPILGPLDIGLGGPQYSQSSGGNDYYPYPQQHPTGDQSIIDKVLDRLQLLGDAHNEIDPTLSDMNDPSALIMPAQEHPSHTLYPFTRSHQGICVDDSLDGWPVSPSYPSKTSQGIKSSLDSVRENVPTSTVRSPTGIRTPPPPPTVSIPSRPRIKHAETYSNSSSYTDVTHSNYSSYSDASYGGLKQKMTMQAITSSPLIQALGMPSTSSSISSYLPLSPGIQPHRHLHPSHSHHSQGPSVHDSDREFSLVTTNVEPTSKAGSRPRQRAESSASATSISSIGSSSGDMSVVNLIEGTEQGNSGSSVLRSDNRRDRHQKSDPIPSANDVRHDNQRSLKKKQSMSAISTSPGSASGAIAPSKDGKDTKKSKKLWSGFGGSSSSPSSSSQMLISEPIAVGPPSISPTDPRNTSSLSRSIDTNNPWFKDLILISSPPKPSSIHSAANVTTSTSNSKKSSGRGFTSKSMVSLSKSSTSLDHTLPPPPSHSHHQYRDSVSLNRTRSPSISILENPRHSYQPLVPNTPQSPKLLSIRHLQESEQFTSDPIPSVGDLLTGFSADENSLERTNLSTIASSSGSRQCKSGPIPIITTTIITTPLSPRLPAWTRFGDKSQAHKNTKLCVDPETQTPLYDDRTRLAYYVQDSGQQTQVDYISGVSRHIIAPVELAQAMEQEEEEARRLKGREKQVGSEETIMDKSGSASISPPPPPLPLRRGLTIMRSPTVETSSLDIASKKQGAVDGQAPEAVTQAPANEILPSAIAVTAASTAPALQDMASTPKVGLVPEPRRLSVSITAVTVTHAQVTAPGPVSPPPVIPRRSPHRSIPISPILRDV